MKQTYQEFLEESTNTVKAKRNLGEIVLLSAYFAIWAVAMIVVLQTNGYTTSNFGVVFRWLILPLFLLISTVIVAKNDYWGKGKWMGVIVAAITFLTVPYAQYVEDLAAGTATFSFRFPNFMYMVVGIIISVCGLGIGNLWRMKISSKENM